MGALESKDSTNKLYLANSPIHGTGVFTKSYMGKGEKITIPFKDKQVVGFGHYFNHSFAPNTHVYFDGKNWYMVADKPIQPFQELTANYDDPRMPNFILGVGGSIGYENVNTVNTFAGRL